MSRTGHEEVVRRFDERAAGYDSSVAHQWQAEGAVRTAELTSGQRVLDVATGTGLAARFAAEAVGGGGEIVGVDVAQAMLEVARRKSPSNCRYVAGDGVQLPAGLGRFDHVLCVAGLPYLDDPALALQSWQAALGEAGQITFTVPTDHGISVFTLLQEAAAAEGLTLATPNAGLGSVEALRAAAAELGLVVRARTEAAFDQGPLSGDPNTVVDNYLGLGHAEPLRVAPSEQRNAVIDRFVTAFEHRRGTPSQHAVVFARLGP